MYPQVLLQNRKPDRIATLEEYRQSGGYRALANVLKDYSYKDVQQTIMDANLLGRGGAAFPTGMKLMSVADDADFPRYIIRSLLGRSAARRALSRRRPRCTRVPAV